ncbi:hypothetical protein Tco_0812833 [Tanacetum coccineum]
MDERKKHFAKLRAEKIRRKPPTKAQKRNQMSTYLRNQVVEGSEKKTESSRKETVSKKRADELQLCLEIVPRDDEAVNVESLSTKYHLVDWKTTSSIRLDVLSDLRGREDVKNITRYFSAHVDDFDRQDVLDLYRLVRKDLKQQAQKDMTDYFGEIL